MKLITAKIPGDRLTLSYQQVTAYFFPFLAKTRLHFSKNEKNPVKPGANFTHRRKTADFIAIPTKTVDKLFVSGARHSPHAPFSTRPAICLVIKPQMSRKIAVLSAHTMLRSDQTILYNRPRKNLSPLRSGTLRIDPRSE